MMYQKLLDLWNKQSKVPVSVSVLTLGVGLGVGYIYGKKNRQQIVYAVDPPHPSFDRTSPSAIDFSALNEAEELDQAEDVESPEEDEEMNSIEDLGRTFIESAIDREAESPLVIEVSVFPDEEDVWDWEKELSQRSNTIPYILNRKEFDGNELNFTQITVTWYEGDQILAADDDTPIYNGKSILGEFIFGHGSEDPNIVYVRNHDLKTEYEVLRDRGLYSVEVEGLEIQDNARTRDLKHSTSPRKFRQD